ncbi:MAG: UTP--glucose-1-phosphate uridylyltransferase [Actinomycetota bacterium]
MPIRKAVIPAAGLGTRFLPASKAVPKELLCVVDRPGIQYAVEELSRAGVTDICIVISEGKEAIGEHFGANYRLETALATGGKDVLLREVKRLQDLAEIYTVHQNKPLGLGHAVGVARDHMDGEPFVVVLPDEIYDPNVDTIGGLIKAYEETEVSVAAVTRVPGDEIRLYGAISTSSPDDRLMPVDWVVEKPEPQEAPSDLALVGRYVLHPEIFDVLADLPPGSSGEIQLSDALGVLGGKGRLYAYRYDGRRWDIGTKLGYLKASVELGAEHPELGEQFQSFLRSLMR